MNRRRVLWVTVAAVGLCVVGFAWWVTRPSPLEAAYHAIQIGQAAADVDRLAPDTDDVEVRIPAAAASDWAGFLDGLPREVHLTAKTPFDDPALAATLFVRLPRVYDAEVTRPTVWTFFDRASGRVVARRQHWFRGADGLFVIYGPDGTVREKAFVRGRTEPGRWEQMLGPLWPF